MTEETKTPEGSSEPIPQNNSAGIITRQQTNHLFDRIGAVIFNDHDYSSSWLEPWKGIQIYESTLSRAVMYSTYLVANVSINSFGSPPTS